MAFHHFGHGRLPFLEPVIEEHEPHGIPEVLTHYDDPRGKRLSDPHIVAFYQSRHRWTPVQPALPSSRDCCAALKVAAIRSHTSIGDLERLQVDAVVIEFVRGSFSGRTRRTFSV